MQRVGLIIRQVTEQNVGEKGDQLVFGDGTLGVYDGLQVHFIGKLENHINVIFGTEDF